uniref:Uncharacterized protein n=1 Tax=Anguilla anguilla TaxID=7936 RepID=A0A0E9S2Q6_ANGAN
MLAFQILPLHCIRLSTSKFKLKTKLK